MRAAREGASGTGAQTTIGSPAASLNASSGDRILVREITETHKTRSGLAVRVNAPRRPHPPTVLPLPGLGGRDTSNPLPPASRLRQNFLRGLRFVLGPVGCGLQPRGCLSVRRLEARLPY